ncbi:MAG: hypothetical protein RBS57_14950, partial [Desulforhabdus sp.]|nr:hypothetical protein [Desulforhabdus sp.]
MRSFMSGRASGTFQRTSHGHSCGRGAYEGIALRWGALSEKDRCNAVQIPGSDERGFPHYRHRHLCV